MNSTRSLAREQKNRSLLDETNSIARGPTGGRTSKEDSALTWNRVHPLTLQFGRFESRDKDRECLWEYKKESCPQEPLNEGHSAYVLCVTECSKRKGHQSHPHCFQKRRKVDLGESWTLTLFHHEYILMCERESFFSFFFFFFVKCSDLQLDHQEPNFCLFFPSYHFIHYS